MRVRLPTRLRARRSPSLRTLLGLAGAAAAGAIVTALFMMSKAAAPDPAVAQPAAAVRASIELPSTAPLALGTHIPLVGFDSNVVALSSDSRYLAYVGQSASGTMLYLRELAGSDVTPLAGTAGAIHAFFSPDGRWLGFLTNDRVKKIALNGGAPITIADAREPVRARWTRDDTIYFSEYYGMRLSRVSAGGGTPTPVGPSDDAARSFSDVLPDGKWALRTDSVRSISADWLDQSCGCCLKVVAPLIPHLPQRVACRVIVMNRDLDEIVASQHRMLDRGNQESAKLTDAQLKTFLKQQLALAVNLLGAHGVPTLVVSHAETLQQPELIAARVQDFLGRPLELSAMSRVVDSMLYRERAAAAARS